MDRAYSILEVKAVNEDQRIITGIATSPEPDRMGDIVEPLGVKFKNPLPLLHQHRSDMPVGTVRFEKPTKDGITFTAKLPKIATNGPLQERVDTAWEEVKAGLVRGVSIGFRSIEFSRLDNGGLRFLETEVLELSLVTIPANADATIQTIKSIDADVLTRAAEDTGTKPPSRPDRSVKPAGSAPRKTLKAMEPRKMKQTIAEQISAFEAKRGSQAARILEMVEKAGETGETFDAEQEQEHKDLNAEIEAIDKHLAVLRSAERLQVSSATPIEVRSAEDGSEARGGREHIRVQVKPNVEKGIPFVRALWCKVHGGLNHMNPADVAKSQPWADQTPEVERYLRTAVTAGNTTDNGWAGYLVDDTNLASEFAELLRPATIIGRIPGITRVPFNVKVNRETTAASVSWVGEAGVKPVSAMAFDQISLAFNKVAGIVPVTDELFRFSSPAIEGIIRNSLITSVAYLIDRDFLDPTKTEVTGVSPASVTNGVTPITASGTTADALRHDLGLLLAEYIELNMSIASLVLVMTATQAMQISLMRNTLGQREFEGLGRDGGSLEGIPVIISENIVATGGSPTDGGLIVAMNARDILLADDGGVNIDMSREASLQMDTAPDSPNTASTVLVSLWQRNMVALKAERFITWKKRRDGAVQFIQNAKYSE